MNPQSPDTDRRSAVSIELSVKWSRYLAVRDDRSHRELLRAADRFIRAESQRMLSSQAHLAEEAAQEALLGVERKIATMEAPDHPAAYIRKVLVNKISDILQRESKRRIREEWYSEPEVINVDLTPTTDWHDFLGILRDTISQDEFWTLVLRHHFEFSYDEIGELLEKQPGAIRQIALRGRRKACERMARLEGRVPAWLDLGDDSGGTARRAGASETVDNPRRVVDNSGSGDPRSLGGEVTGLGGAANPQVELPVAEPPPTSLGPSIAGLVRRAPTVGKRWLLSGPPSVIPLVILLAVPAVAQTRGPGSLAVRTPTIVGAAGPTDSTAGTAETGRGKEVGALPDQPPAGPSSDAYNGKSGSESGSSTSAERASQTATIAAVQTDETTTTLPTKTDLLAATTSAPTTAPASPGATSATAAPVPPLSPTTTPPGPATVAATTVPATTSRTTPPPARRSSTSRTSTPVRTTARTTRTTRRTTTTRARTTTVKPTQTTTISAAPTTTTTVVETTTTTTTTAAPTTSTIEPAATTTVEPETTTTTTTAPTTTTSTTTIVAQETTTTVATITTTTVDPATTTSFGIPPL